MCVCGGVGGVGVRVCVCARVCSLCYLFHGPPHPYDIMSRMLRLNAFFFAIYFVLIEEVCINIAVEVYRISK